jgi:glycerol-3-phosphate dehydrogenase (NAD(P)+)
MRIAVIGAGSWGTTLANLLAKKGLEVILWAYERDLVERMQLSRVNDLFLPGVRLADRLDFTNDLAAAAAGRPVVVLVSPSQVMRRVVGQLRPHLEADSLLVSAANGI